MLTIFYFLLALIFFSDLWFIKAEFSEQSTKYRANINFSPKTLSFIFKEKKTVFAHMFTPFNLISEK